MKRAIRTLPPLVVLFLFLTCLPVAGCEVSRPSYMDREMGEVVATLGQRPEVAKVADTTVPISLVLRGPTPPQERISDWTGRLGDLYTPGEKFTEMFASGFRSGQDWLALREPIESYFGTALGPVLRAKGFVVEPGAPSTLVVTVNRYWIDFQMKRTTTSIDATVEVTGPDRSPYRRGVVVEGIAEEDRVERIFAPESAGKRKSLTSIQEAYFRFQDELLADPDLWNALR